MDNNGFNFQKWHTGLSIEARAHRAKFFRAPKGQKAVNIAELKNLFKANILYYSTLLCLGSLSTLLQPDPTVAHTNVFRQ